MKKIHAIIILLILPFLVGCHNDTDLSEGISLL